MTSTYAVTFAVTTDQHLDDDQARDVAARWAALTASMPGATGFDLGMTSTSRDEPWLRVSGLLHLEDGQRVEVELAEALLRGCLGDVGASVTEWHAVEVWSEAELERRTSRPAVPPMVNAVQLAELAGITVQRIYQYESDRKAGKRGDFPAPALDGYWLRTVAEHWAATRKRRPGPAAKG